MDRAKLKFTLKQWVLIFCAAVFALWVIKFVLDRSMEPALSADNPQVRALFFELEQKFRRQTPGNGYSLNYRIQPPHTIEVLIAYPAADKLIGREARDVGNAAREFVLSMGEQKYGIHHLQVEVIYRETESE